MYEKFKELDGTHPWRDVSPDGFIDYNARYRPKGRVLYFNFPLARELELIPLNHPHLINKDLERVILETFSLQIINEYDLKLGQESPPGLLSRAITWRPAICKLNTLTNKERLPEMAEAFGMDTCGRTT